MLSHAGVDPGSGALSGRGARISIRLTLEVFCRMSATPFLNVGMFISPICALISAVEQIANSKPRTVRFIASRRLRALTSYPRSRLSDHIKNLQQFSDTLAGIKCP
jgi:hypothetical protein